MPNSDYPDLIDRLADGALSQMRDYFSLGIETPGVAMLEDRAVGTAAKLAYFNTIKNHLRLVESGQQRPADALAHLDDRARVWMAQGSASRDPSLNGATMAIAMADQWENWALGGPGAKERVGFVNHFRLRE